MSKICDDLRAAILQAAMQGKLTKQLAEDDDAEELLNKIAQDKTSKGIKTTNLPAISDSEKSFELPKNWIWIRIGEAFNCIMGSSPDGNSVSKNPDDGIEFHQGKIFFTDRIIEHSGDYTTDPVRIANANSALLCVRAPIGKVNITDRELCIGRGLASIEPLAEMSVDYTYYLLQSLEEAFISKGTGSTFKAISKDVILSQVFCLPPLAEQKRIVEKVDELMARVTDLEQSADALASLKKAFPDDIKASLLQYAMQGKLTKQLPEDGNSEDLLEEIRAEKEKLITEGKIKKQKALAPITEEEIPFSIPENWRWVRLSELFQFINGDRGKNYPSKSKLHTSGEIPFISAINMQNGTVREDNLLYADRSTYDKLGSGKLNKSDFVICIRGSLGKYCKYPYKIGAIASSLVIARKYSESIIDDYFDMYLQSSLFYNEIHAKDNGTAQPNLSAADLANFLIPLPPIATQRYIAERLKILIQNINVVRELTASE